MASNDHIHNRLTHSIEVASVGRSFAVRVADIADDIDGSHCEKVSTLAWVLQSACLMHDLGNPPFGHAGEEVIREWASEHEDLLFPTGQIAIDSKLEACRRDWKHFEGNAQGFRLAARPDNPAAGYLRLTYATLGAAMKYPWSSIDPRTEQKCKHSVHSSEVDVFEDVAATLGLVRKGTECCRHPLSFLTEAADDICYRIIDLEDAVEMGICDCDKVHRLFLRISKNPKYKWMKLSQLRGQAIKSLMDQCWAVFEDNLSSIMDGTRTDDLKSSLDSECTKQLAAVDKLYNSIFGHRKKVATELGAYHVLGRILEAMVNSIQSIAAVKRYEDVHFLSKRTIELTWGKEHVKVNMSKPYRWWLSQVMDYVSGMTDDYATRLSREIGGISTALE